MPTFTPLASKRISGINDVQNIAISVHQPVASTGATCALLGGMKGTSFVVHGLVVVPVTDLILVFDVDPGHRGLRRMNGYCSQCGQIELGNTYPLCEGRVQLLVCRRPSH